MVIKCQECITARHLFERTISAVEDVLVTQASLSAAAPVVDPGRCETLSAFVVHLQRTVERSSQLQGRSRRGKFILVFDGIDRQREAPSTLLPALTRLRGLMTPTSQSTIEVTTLFILTTPRPGYLSTPGVPHVHFPAYTKAEALTILSGDPLPIFPPSSSHPSPTISEVELEAEDNHWLWTRFTSIVYDSLCRSTARTIPVFRSTCHKLWPAFTAPVVQGLYGTRDFSKLMIAKRALFQSEDVLLERIVKSVGGPTATTATATAAALEGGREETLPLSYQSKFLLCAAYLASYNPARQDAVFFMKTTERRRRKKGGGTSTRGSAKAGVTKHRKIPRRSLNPHPFVLERLLAIFHSILPDHVVGRAGAAEVQTQVGLISVYCFFFFPLPFPSL